MAYIHINYYSDALKVNTDVGIILPLPLKDEKDKGYFKDGALYQTLYLLHGTYGDYTDWMRMTSIERYAQEMRLAVVMPSCANAFYLNMVSGAKYETFLLEELPQYLCRIFPLSKAREDTFIAGLSMGGYGAMHIGLMKPDRYSAIGSLSGLFSFAGLLAGESPNGDNPWPGLAMVGELNPKQVDESEYNVIVRARNLVAQGVKLPDMFLSVGTEDFTLDENRRGRTELTRLGIKLTYEEHKGEHNWEYWDRHIRRFLEWLPLKHYTV